MKISILPLVLSLFSPSIFAIPSQYTNIAMTGASKPALEVGLKIQQKGGNVVDVAVAIGLAMSVTNPFNASLGGGGFALVKMNNSKVKALDFREVAPSKTHSKYYLENKKRSSTDGPHAIGVPGFLAGLYEMHKKFGKLDWQELVLPAIDLAENGFPVSGRWVEKTKENRSRFNSYGKKYFFKNKSRSYTPSELMKQPQLASALKLIKKDIKSFYQGEIAKDIVSTIQDSGGSILLEDFKNYKVKWMSPLKHNQKGLSFYTMPPPSSGGIVIISALKLIDKINLQKQTSRSFNEYHLMAEVLKASYRGRSELADPDFAKLPSKKLLSDKYLNSMAKKINTKKVSRFEPLSVNFYKETPETTHFNVMDRNGQAVSLTVTLNGAYGSGMVSKEFGISLNNEMDDFTTRPDEPNMFGLIQGKNNSVEAGKRPLSSMSPSLILKDKKVIMTLGAPGGPRIISSVLQTIYRVIYKGMDIDQAIQAPRVHHQFLPNKTYIDKNKFSPELIQSLKARGHNVEESWMALVNGIRKNKNNFLEASFDSRGEGYSIGN